MKRRPASLVTRAVAAGALGLLPLVLGGSAHAAGTASLGGWNISSDGNAIDFLYDNATGLAGVHPFTEADVPATQTQFETGPFGSALATVFWPGSAGGDFGSLSAELGLPSQLQPLAAKLNDPVRAATQYPAGPTSASYPAGNPGQAFEMQSSSTASGSTATAALVDANNGSVFSYSTVRGASASTVDAAGHAVGTASTDLTGISLLGGLVHIGSITSVAKTTSDGNKSSGSAVTHVGEITVAGEKASIGNDGLVLPDFAKALGPLLGPLVQKDIYQVITDAGLTIRTLPSLKTHSGPSFSVQSGAVQIKMIPPAGGVQALESLEPVLQKILPPQAGIIATLPGLFQGASFTITLGRSFASTAASPPFNLNFVPPAIPPFPTSTNPSPVAGSAPAASVPSAVTGTGATPAASPGTAPLSTGPSSAPLAVAKPISLSSPLAIGAVILGLLVASALGYGLFRVARGVLPEDAGPGCPLAQENP